MVRKRLSVSIPETYSRISFLDDALIEVAKSKYIPSKPFSVQVDFVLTIFLTCISRQYITGLDRSPSNIYIGIDVKRSERKLSTYHTAHKQACRSHSLHEGVGYHSWESIEWNTSKFIVHQRTFSCRMWIWILFKRISEAEQLLGISFSWWAQCLQAENVRDLDQFAAGPVCCDVQDGVRERVCINTCSETDRWVKSVTCSLLIPKEDAGGLHISFHCSSALFIESLFASPTRFPIGYRLSHDCAQVFLFPQFHWLR